MKVRLILLVVVFLCLSTQLAAAEFKDVNEQHSLHLEINYLANERIISGYPDGTFKPKETLAKKHMAAMLVKALKLPTTNVQNPGYKDVPTTHPYYKEIAAGYTAGLYKKATYFQPNAAISRGYMAQLLAQALKLSHEGAQLDFTDVKASSPYYKAIQAVTMKNIANGSVNEAGDAVFNPNALLTRGHFSAFLARALTLQEGDYMPQVGHDYVYQLSSGETLHFENEYSDDYGDLLWTAYDDKRSIIDQSVYGIMDGVWFEGVPSTDIGTFVQYPFTIGVKYDYLSGLNGPAGKQSILTTDAVVTLNGQTFENVIVVEDLFYEYFGNESDSYIAYQRAYIAPNYGIIKIENGRGNEAPDWTRELTERIKRQDNYQ